MTNYLFDIKILATVRMNAPDEKTARYWLDEHLSGVEANLGCWVEGPDIGEPIIAGCSVDGYADLIEVDGEAV